MWNLKVQLWLRRICLTLLVVAVGYGLWSLRQKGAGSTHVEVKILATHAEMALKNASWSIHLYVFLAIFWLLMAGVPTIIALATAIFCWGPVPGFLLILFFHTCITWMVLKYKIGVSRISPEVVTALEESQLEAAEISALPRVFLTLPPRSLDVMIARLVRADESLVALALRSAIGTLFRLALECFWYLTFLNVLIDFRPFPERDFAWFLVASALMIVSCIWPKIPELIPGKAGMAVFCQTWTGEVPPQPILAPEKTGNDPLPPDIPTNAAAQPAPTRPAGAPARAQG